MQSHHIHLSGQPFHYLTWGSPDLPPLLMLHGFPEYSGAWDELASRLCDRFYCIAPDQRGYGQSWAPPEVGEYTTSNLVGDMAALIEALDLAPCTVLGHDWGSAVAYGLAMMAPDLVSRLIIVNGVHPAPFQRAIAAGGAQTEASQYIHYLRRDGSEDELAANDFAKLLSLFSAHMDLSWLTGPRLAAYKREWARPGRMRGMVNWYRASPLRVGTPGKPLTDLPTLPRERLMVRQPHLLIWGANDTALLPEATEGLEEFAPNLTRVTIDGADHWLCHQNPDAVAVAILDWIATRP
ncbi:alpha/beta fold hydrolase [Marimonas lutisalis]|uniref:alpha/beta fold hydrolase n=1 Tax=Marimonas lutisalis TaxID=2545756 RepID=UPI0010F92765|nr:alpha/beta hydrolase [Marimonas lutisalis]